MSLEIADRYWLELQEYKKTHEAHTEREADLKQQYEDRLRAFEFEAKDDLAEALGLMKYYRDKYVIGGRADNHGGKTQALLHKYGHRTGIAHTFTGIAS